MSKPVPFTSEIAEEFGVTWIDPYCRPDIANQGLHGVCEWRPGVALADIGKTNLTLGQVHALPPMGQPRMAIKERHPQDEIFAVFQKIILGFSKTMEETAGDVVWAIMDPGVYVIRAGVIHVPPTSYYRGDNISPMVVIQGTENTTEATEVNIPIPD